MNQTLILTFKGKTAFVMPIAEMGGGIEGYIVSGSEGEHIGTLDIPRGATPGEQWTHLSELGKNRVRAHGWQDFGTEQHAIALAFKSLGILPDSDELNEFITLQGKVIQSINDQAATEFEALFNRSNKNRYTSHFDKLVGEFQDAVSLLYIAETLDSYIVGLDKEWASWPIPATNN